LIISLTLSCLSGCQMPGERADSQFPSPYDSSIEEIVPDDEEILDDDESGDSAEDAPTAPNETSGGVGGTPDDPSWTPSAGCDPDGEHEDADNNGRCDQCDVSVIIVLDLFAINDLHGKFCDSAAQSGVDEMTTYLRLAYQREDYVLILSSGDMWQGSSESNLTKGQIVTEWMNELDFVSMTLGNHEYDWGEEYIVKNSELAEFPFLAINVYDVDTDRRADYCEASIMVKRGGANIGIIGAIGDCHSSISGEFSDGVYFKTGSELTALVKAEAERLRAEGADFIVYSIHDGYGRSSSGVESVTDSYLSSYYDPALSEGYVDIVFEGHSHQSYVLVDGNGVYHMQGGGDNKGICHAEAVINFANEKCEIQVAEFISSSVYENLSDDPIVESLMKKYEEQVSEGDKVLGTNDFYRGGDELRQLVAELYLKAGFEEFGGKYDVVLGGGFISVRSPYGLSAGQVTYSQLQMLFPFDNELVLCSVKGSDLKNKFINTSNSNYFVAYSDYGNSVKGNINSAATYYVIVDTYTSTYAPNRLTEVARFAPGVYARDLLAAYVGAGGMTKEADGVSYTSVAEILRIGGALADNGTTESGYYVKGRVTSVENTTYGNLYIQDDEGNRLFVYGVYDPTGSVRYDGLNDPPTVGDEIVLFGKIKKYVNQSTKEVIIELISARLIDES